MQPAYPYHQACLKVLARFLGIESQDIDKDVLYAVFSQNSSDWSRALLLDYGPIEGPEQC